MSALPSQSRYIIGTEACERFSFYGMRNILVPFLISSVLLAYLPDSERAGTAKDLFHTFVIGVYFFPLLGGWLSDRYFGKYNTVLWFSLVYCAGQILFSRYLPVSAAASPSQSLLRYALDGMTRP